MLHRLAQQRITSSHLEWPFHQNQHYPQSASRDLSAVADVLVWITAISLLTRLACDRRIVDPSVKWLTLKAVRPRYMFVILIDFLTYSTTHVISPRITRESLRCPVGVRSESPATGSLFALRLLANYFTLRWSLTASSQDGVSAADYAACHVRRPLRAVCGLVTTLPAPWVAPVN